jgi:hypothetical protein
VATIRTICLTNGNQDKVGMNHNDKDDLACLGLDAASSYINQYKPNAREIVACGTESRVWIM